MDSKITEKRLFTREERQTILDKTAGKCAHCGKGLDTKSMTIDHVFPRSKGGLNDEYNLLPLCEDCNEKKSDSVFYIKDYYKNIIEEEFEKFYLYSNFASFDYVSKSIIGFDEIMFEAVPHEYKAMIENMKKRKAKKKAIENFRKRVSVKFLLRRAYPANAEDIYKLIEHCREKFNDENKFYHSDIDVLNDIETGYVYILENNRKVCGAFIFKNIKTLDTPIDTLQLENVKENFGLSSKYVMTCAITDLFAMPAFGQVMQFLEVAMIQSKLTPLFFDILEHCHAEKNKCIRMPFHVNGVDTKLEFMPVKYLKDRYRDIVMDIFDNEGYENPPFEDIDIFADVYLKHTCQAEWKGNEIIEEFFEKYRRLKIYFKPESFPLYGIGFLNKETYL